jgi:hypothetical protein
MDGSILGARAGALLNSPSYARSQTPGCGTGGVVTRPRKAEEFAARQPEGAKLCPAAASFGSRGR